jgi:hypothetical protein
MARPILPETVKILEFLNKNGNQPFSEAVKILGDMNRSKYDMVKQGWRKRNQAVAGPAKVKKLPPPKNVPRRNTPKVASTNLAEAMAFIQKGGGYAAVKARHTQEAAFLLMFENISNQVKAAS